MKAYEKAQLAAIERWKKETPGFLSQAFDLLTAPIAWLAAQVIPDELARTAIMGFESVARRMINIDDFLEYEKISSLEDLRTKDLRLSDSLAEGVHNRAIGMAGASGAALGATGIGGRWWYGRSRCCLRFCQLG